MVYTPRSYLIPAAVALVALQMQQAAATSLFYDPYTSADTTDEISSKFPARGADVSDKDCAITVEVDPTLPDIATISTVTVTYTDLLANTSTAPTESVSTKVGTVIYSVDTPAASANQDAYTITTTTSTSTSSSTTSTTQTSTTSSGNGTKTSTKTGTTVSQTSTSTSTTTSTTTGKKGVEATTTAPATTAPATTSSSVGGSSEEEATSSSNGGSSYTQTTSSSVGGSSSEETTATVSPIKSGATSAPTTTASSSVGSSSYEDTTSTASPTKTGVTSAPETTASSVDASSDEDITATVSPSKTGVTTATVSPSKTATTSAPDSTETSVAGSSYEDATPATTTASATKTGVITSTSAPATKSTDVEGTSATAPKDCATGWEDQSSRKLRHSPMSGRRLQEKMEKKRHLEANTNKDIAKLEAYFGTSMEVNLASLPTVGVHTPSPWPGPYWPTYQDGINVIWSPGEASPAEKYATAFGLDVTDFMDKVSKDNGIDSMSSHTVCSSDSDCSSLTDGSSCAIRTGKSSGYCIPTWYGICHAWTPAAMLETEPRCAVTYNGVTFQPMDLKALVSDVYDGATVSTVFTGTRYNGGTDSTDEYGRHSSDSYRDLNPAFFHIAAANLLGKLNATFIADVTAGSEVWNQPVRGFKVYEQTNMTLKEAASTFYGLDEYPWNAAAKSIVYVKARMSWIFETYTDGALVSTGKVDSYTTGAYYYYLLEMDDNGNIIGGEWVYDSDNDHPDFIWFPKAKPAADTVTSIGLSYADVTMLLEKSVACEGSSSGSTAAGSTESSSLASPVASNPGSAAFSSQPGSVSTGSAASTASFPTGSNNAATVAPVTDVPVTDTPVSTETTTGAWTTAPATTTATPSTNQWAHNNQGSGNGNGQGWLSFFHWW
ncbi:putative transglutaminase elicitor [Phytophthora cinnamomi]|uniref:putative transglutaminase elicitor n=1 Tax=Phytophthora cinnamomi TaxID=4785 RepID=UPI0035595E7A|nr:putative transglutaminase elicitor [Phytophthora cinnamomi]